MNSPITKTLWMGDIDSFIDEDIIYTIFRNLNIKIKYVRIIRDKQTGLKQGYCFIDFETREEAIYFLENYNGKPIPNTNRLFKLNWAMHNTNRTNSSTNVSDNNTSPINSILGNNNNQKYLKKQKHFLEFTIYVGELDLKVNEETLMNFFKEYRSINSVKIITEPNSKISKGFGFIKFTNYFEFSRALKEMNGRILFNKAIKVNQAGQKRNFGEFQNENLNGNHITNYNNTYNHNNHSIFQNNSNLTNQTNLMHTNNFTQNNFVYNEVLDFAHQNSNINTSINDCNRNFTTNKKFNNGNFINTNGNLNMQTCESLNSNSFKSAINPNSLNEDSKNCKNSHNNNLVDNFSIENMIERMENNNKSKNEENSVNFFENYIAFPDVHGNIKRSFSNIYENRKCPMNNFLYYYNIIEFDKEINFLDQFYISFSKYGHSYECITDFLVDRSKTSVRQDYLLNSREGYCNNSGESFYNSENSAMGSN